MNNKETAVALVKLLTEYSDGLSGTVISRKLHISSESSFFQDFEKCTATRNREY